MNTRILVSTAIRQVPDLTVFGKGLWPGPNLTAGEPLLFATAFLRDVEKCAAWVKGRSLRATFNARLDSARCSHLVSNRHRQTILHGAFIAAGVGLGLEFKTCGPVVLFKFADSRRDLRERINVELASWGQRLRGNSIVQEFDEPMILPCRPRIIQRDVDLQTLAYSLGVA